MMTRLLIFLTCCCILAEGTAYSAQRLPPRHYADYGACPFECCTYREWTVEADTTFYRRRSTASPVAFRARKGERVNGLTGVVITLEPGKAVVLKATTLRAQGGQEGRLRPGDVLYLLHYEGEGVYKIWFRGKFYEDQVPIPPDPAQPSRRDGRGEYIQTLSGPKTVWWMKVKNRRGQVGWSKQNDHFDNVDACG